jgi:hypothetical protein
METIAVMDLTYMLRAADGREYGPVTQVQVVAWVHEGRVGEFSELRRSDMQHWAAAREFDEFQFLFGGGAQPATPVAEVIAPPPAAPKSVEAVSQVKSGASWFYWIAALSLINSIVLLFGGAFRFIFALGITQVIDSFGWESGMTGKAVAFTANLFITGGVAALGYFAGQGKLWAFIVGMALYSLDGLLLVLAQRWLDAGLHVVVLFFIFRGFQACRALRS